MRRQNRKNFFKSSIDLSDSDCIETYAVPITQPRLDFLIWSFCLTSKSFHFVFSVLTTTKLTDNVPIVEAKLNPF